MAIKGLLDTALRPGEGFPRIGKLHKGAARTEADLNKNRPGKDLGHFRMTFEPQFEHLEPLWNELYGEQPEVFDPVYVYGETVDAAFDYWKEEWTATKLLHRCDGDEQTLHFDSATGNYVRAKVGCAAPSCQCKPVGRLSLLLPDFADASGVLGVILAETHSIHDIIELHRTLTRIHSLTGTLMGIPFRFGRAPEKISVPKSKGAQRTGERMNVEKSLFYLHVNERYTRQYFLPALASAAAAPLFGNVAPAQIPATVDVERAKHDLGNTVPRRLPVAQEPDDDVVDGETDDTWTPETLRPRIESLFKHGDHAVNGIALYSNPEGDAYVLYPDLSLDQAEAAVRFYRSLNGKLEKPYIFQDEKTQDKFIGACVDLVRDDAAVVAALDAVANYALSGVAGWKGDKTTAWAAVLAYAANYDYEQVAFTEQSSEVLRYAVRLVCAFVAGQQAQESAPVDEQATDAEFATL